MSANKHLFAAQFGSSFAHINHFISGVMLYPSIAPLTIAKRYSSSWSNSETSSVCFTEKLDF